MQKRITIWLLLFVSLGLVIIHPSFAQKSSEKDVINKLHNKKEGIFSDTTTLTTSIVIDSLKKGLLKKMQDSTRGNFLLRIAEIYSGLNPDSSFRYTGLALELFRKSMDKKREISALWEFGWLCFLMGDYNKSQEYLLLGQKLAAKANLKELMPANLLIMAKNINSISGDYKKPIELTKQALAISLEYRINNIIIIAPHNLCAYYYELNNLDSAFYYGKMVLRNADSLHANWMSQVSQTSVRLFACKKEWGNAIAVYSTLLKKYNESGRINESAVALMEIANLFQKWSKTDSAIYYAKQSFQILKNTKYYEPAFRSAFLLYELYLPKDKLKALYYLSIANENREAQLKNSRQFSLRNLEDFELKENEYETQKAESIYTSKVQRNIFISAISIIAVIAISVYVSNRRHRFLNTELQSQKKQLENSLQQLKETQSQLIQSEKMASLGELTAGIAHEIQNPLNFVNNFSEVNKELLLEMKEEVDKGNLEEVKAIANDVIDNEEKINHHGKRADAIVKGMLQHSRSSSGQKEPTDINALCDEYFRLTYHGLRAKDKSFNATMKTDFDETIGAVNIIPQEIGRVLFVH